jgi:uncharacterized protein YuzE
MKIDYDKSIDVAYIYLQDTKIEIIDSEEVSSGVIFDYDNNNDVVGIEILHVKKRTPEEMKNVYRQNLQEKDQKALENIFSIAGSGIAV